MDYKHTLRLPQTDFPMKADLAKREPERLKHWTETDLYHAILKKSAGRPEFRLHDGPPYANGMIHHGHMLNKVLKDITVKYRTMAGHYVEYIPGWDTHGLPIEHQVDKELGEKKHTISALDKRAACEKYARSWVAVQREGFERLGILGEWSKPYLTLNHDYEAAIVRVLASFCDKGSMVRGKKPVHWCYVCETALAEAEVEYEDHTSPSIYVKYPVRKGLPLSTTPVSVLIWTTTPWTLQASLAVSVAPDADYVVATITNRKGVTEDVLVADKLLGDVLEATKSTLVKKGDSIKGDQLAGMVSEHPWIADRAIPTLLGGHVTLDAGTGLVHTAPGHGPDDFVIGAKYGLEPYAPIDRRGVYIEGKYTGQQIMKANPVIVADLDAADRLLNEPGAALKHSYPMCWRSHNPVVFRATPQWFISMEQNDLRKNALAEIDRVRWIPTWGRERIYNMVAGRPDWCISRQRSWGVPIPVFYCGKCEEPMARGDVMRHVGVIFAKDGADAWFARSAAELLPAGTSCGKCSATVFKKETDILDVWFESGVSYAAVYANAPVRDKRTTDLYLEGSDQHRGWFHSALLCSVGTTGKAPYEAVLTHGFVVDGQGKKISKSKGNYVDPQKAIEARGAEIIRLWVAAEDYRDDIRLSEEILTRLSEAYRKIRNTWRFLLGNLGDFPADAHAKFLGDGADAKSFDLLDQYALHITERLSQRVQKAYADYNYHQVFHALNEFCSVELSAFYLDVLKDRLYIEAQGSAVRMSAQRALWNIADTLFRLAAPVLVFTADEAYQHLPKLAGSPASVHLTDLPARRVHWENEALAAEFEVIARVRQVVLKALETERQNKVIGSGLEAQVVVAAPQAEYNVLMKYGPYLPAYFIVSAVELVQGELGAKVTLAAGAKCARCWTYKTEVGKSAAHPLLCQRCETVVVSLS